MSLITASPLVRTYSLEEFWALPEPDDRTRLELIAGVLYMSPPPEQSHDYVIRTLNLVLTAHLAAEALGGGFYAPRAAIWTSDRTHLEPDLFYLSAETEARFRGTRRRTTADLVIEVLSPGSRLYDRTAKADTYRALGVRELWLVDEDARTVEVRNHAEDGALTLHIYSADERLASTVFPRLHLRVGDLFVD